MLTPFENPICGSGRTPERQLEHASNALLILHLNDDDRAESMHATMQMELSRSRETGEGEVQALRAKREQELKNLADAHTQEVARIKQEHDRELQQTQGERASEVERLWCLMHDPLRERGVSRL